MTGTSATSFRPAPRGTTASTATRQQCTSGDCPASIPRGAPAPPSVNPQKIAPTASLPPPPSRGGRPGTSAASVAGTDISYPDTPRFSDVASTAGGSEIMSRLAKLEQELLQERLKREAAEQEMRRLLEQTKGMSFGTAGAGVGAAKAASRPESSSRTGPGTAGARPAPPAVPIVAEKKSVKFTPSTVGVGVGVAKPPAASRR